MNYGRFKMPDNLNLKQKAFCQEYLLNGNNATKAYMSAYPDCSYDSARGSATDLLANPNIKAYLDARLEQVDKSNLLSIEQILLKIQGVAEDEKTKVAERLKSYDLLLKAQGAYKQDLTITNKSADPVDPELIKAIVEEVAPDIYKKFENKKNEAEYLAKCKKWGIQT